MELKEHQITVNAIWKAGKPILRRSADILVRSNALTRNSSENSSSIRALHLVAGKNVRAPPQLRLGLAVLIISSGKTLLPLRLR